MKQSIQAIIFFIERGNEGTVTEHQLQMLEKELREERSEIADRLEGLEGRADRQSDYVQQLLHEADRDAGRNLLDLRRVDKFRKIYKDKIIK